MQFKVDENLPIEVAELQLPPRLKVGKVIDVGSATAIRFDYIYDNHFVSHVRSCIYLARHIIRPFLFPAFGCPERVFQTIGSAVSSGNVL